jgi:hypothetical protein
MNKRFVSSILAIVVMLFVASNAFASTYNVTVTNTQNTELAGLYFVKVQNNGESTIYSITQTDWLNMPDPQTGIAVILSEFSEGEHSWILQQGDNAFLINHVAICGDEYRLRYSELCTN